MSKYLADTIQTFKGKRILVVGDVMLDRYLRGNVTRISPEAPVPIVEMESESYHFGGAANVSLNLKSLGCNTLTLGIIGQDRNSEYFIELAHKEGLDIDGFIKSSDRPTTVKTRIIGDNQHMVRVDREKIIYGNSDLDKILIEKFNAVATDIDAIILEDYNKGVLSKQFIRHILDYSKNNRVITNVDPKFINFNEFRYATVFKPNIKETAQALALPLDTQSQIEEAGRKLLKNLQADNILLTRGEEGLSVFENSGKITHIPAHTRHIADVSGAGDTVIAVLTAAMCAGSSVTDAAIISNHAAGIVCGEVGIVPIDAIRLQASLKQEL